MDRQVVYTKSTGGRFKRKESHSETGLGTGVRIAWRADATILRVPCSPMAHRLDLSPSQRLGGHHDFCGESFMLENWTFEEGDGVIPDTVNGAYSTIYTAAKAGYTGRELYLQQGPVPSTIVSNESSRSCMFDEEFGR